MSPRVIAVLSGGGARVVAQLGALDALAEAGVTPTAFIGTSMGAVLAAGLAAGLTTAEVTERLRVVRREDVAPLDRRSLLLGVFAPALFKSSRLRGTLERLLPVSRFDELTMPLTVTAADLDTGALVLFGDGGVDAPLPLALYASCALPVLYEPAVVGGRRLADGGLRTVLPLEVAAARPADLVVAIDVGPGLDSLPTGEGRPPPALLRAHLDGQFVLMAANTRLALELWRATPGAPPLLYVRPAVRRGDTFALAAVDAYLAAGRDAARAALARGPA